MQETVGGGEGVGNQFREGKTPSKGGGATKPATQCVWEIVQNPCLGMIPLKAENASLHIPAPEAHWVKAPGLGGSESC